MPDTALEYRTAKTREILAVVGTVLLALGCGAAGGAAAGIAGALAGLLIPPGCVALAFAIREPPRRLIQHRPKPD